MSAKRTDDPRPVQFRIGGRARAALDALEAKLSRESLRPVSRSEVVERALLLLARKERVSGAD